MVVEVLFCVKLVVDDDDAKEVVITLAPPYFNANLLNMILMNKLILLDCYNSKTLHYYS
jgi:hypothetical protein